MDNMDKAIEYLIQEDIRNTMDNEKNYKRIWNNEDMRELCEIISSLSIYQFAINDKLIRGESQEAFEHFVKATCEAFIKNRSTDKVEG